MPSPLVYGDYLYLVNDMSSIITCLNAKTGETVWQERLGRPRREGISASPVVVDGKLIENLHVLNAERLVTMAQAIEEMENA